MIYHYLKWPYENEHCDWKNVLNLCKASPEFQRIVTSHFEKYITLSHDRNSGNQLFREYRHEQIWSDDALMSIREAASDKTSPSWHTTLPFGISTYLSKKSQIPFLQLLGKKVWSLKMSLLCGAYRIPGIINYLVECLHLVPNLRRLNLVDIFPYEFTANGDVRPPVVLHEERFVLPDLPYLKMISLIGDCFSCQQWILPKYTSQLEVLDFHDCFLTENFSPTCFPKLEAVHIKFSQRDYYHNACIDKTNELLNKFLLSPLKSISVILDEVDVTKFFNFMLTLNKFGKTLQALEMKFGKMNASMEDEEKSELQGWISQLYFPKLICLHLRDYVGPLEFLLKMPALRKLSIDNSNEKPLQCSNVKGLQFSVNKNGKLEPLIWELFPVLEWLQVGSGEWEWVYHEKRNREDGLPLEYWESY